MHVPAWIPTIGLVGCLLLIIGFIGALGSWTAFSKRIFVFVTFCGLGLAVVAGVQYGKAEADESPATTSFDYDYARTHIPDKTNWGCFQIYPEPEAGR